MLPKRIRCLNRDVTVELRYGANEHIDGKRDRGAKEAGVSKGQEAEKRRILMRWRCVTGLTTEVAGEVVLGRGQGPEGTDPAAAGLDIWPISASS